MNLGDKVKIFRKPRKEENSPRVDWQPEKGQAIGLEGTVVEIHENEALVKFTPEWVGLWFPMAALQKIDVKNPEWITEVHRYVFS